MNFIEQLKQIRKEQKVTQIELSKRTGLKQQYICTLERRSNGGVNIDTLNKIADALGYEIVLCKKNND